MIRSRIEDLPEIVADHVPADLRAFVYVPEDEGKASPLQRAVSKLVADVEEFGADVILLIAACLSPTEFRHLGQKAHALGLEVLLEVHNLEELEQSICEYVDMVGVNNRNLKTVVTSIETSLELAQLIPDNFVKISESSLKDADTILQLRAAGYQGFLIGETFMKTEDPAAALRGLVDEITSKTQFA